MGYRLDLNDQIRLGMVDPDYDPPAPHEYLPRCVCCGAFLPSPTRKDRWTWTTERGRSHPIYYNDHRTGSVVYPIGSFQKRYGRWLSLQAQTNPDRELTERQDAWLRWLVYRYRRQLPKRVVRYACTYGTPEAPRPQMQQRVPKKPIAKDLADRQRETIQRHNDDLRRRGLLPDTT